MQPSGRDASPAASSDQPLRPRRILTARTALDETGWHAKLAIAVIATGLSVPDARAALDAANGVLRKVIEPSVGTRGR